MIAGAIAVLVALVANGVWAAVIVLAVVVGVMQLESHVLQPLLLGRAVRLHPLAVVLALTIGLVTAGIVGALLAVPLLAVFSPGVRSRATRRRTTRPAHPVSGGTDREERVPGRAHTPRRWLPTRLGRAFTQVWPGRRQRGPAVSRCPPPPSVAPRWPLPARCARPGVRPRE
ncbi:AI-2E family transporter [Amycolatopsis sp. NPDC049688]|uniref:AI-2E family transporter n=1 Tax=Amycolatopsis sp. NPDC049688 TaxID=3154733 RepID=UPI003413137B